MLRFDHETATPAKRMRRALAEQDGHDDAVRQGYQAVDEIGGGLIL